MARLKRLFIPGVPQHVIVRGNDRQDIFLADADRYYFLGCLQEAALKNELAVHAYVLMSNHVHLLVTGTSPKSIPKTIQSVGRRYVAHFNCLHRRTGTLWEGRHKAALVQTEGYVINCQRYIEMNPVRAGMVSDPAAYHWSSHRRLAYGRRDDLVTPHPQFIALGRDPCATYRALFDLPLDRDMVDAIRDATHHGWGVGNADFLAWASQICDRPAMRSRGGPNANAQKGEGV
jgi:putative transposase